MVVKIVQQKVNGKTSSFFYSGEIAYAKSKKGTKFSLSAEGDINIVVDGERFSNKHGNKQIVEVISRYRLTDNKLKKLENDGKLVWENNNWFEVLWMDKGSDSWECDIGEVEYDYSSGIRLLKDYLNKDEFG